jgi:DNA-binding CsgD family transcriptional regulator
MSTVGAGPGITLLIDAWHATDKALWGASTPDGFDAALAGFCAATDAIVRSADRADLRDLAGPVDEYRQALLTEAGRLAGRHFPGVREFLRELSDRTTGARRHCLGALDRLKSLAGAKVRRAGQAGAKRRTRVRPLTDRQRRVMEVVAHHDGDQAAAARTLGISRQAVRKHMETSQRKLGAPATTARRPRTQGLPVDLRGQVDVAVGPRAPGGRDRRDRRGGA